MSEGSEGVTSNELLLYNTLMKKKKRNMGDRFRSLYAESTTSTRHCTACRG